MSSSKRRSAISNPLQQSPEPKYDLPSRSDLPIGSPDHGDLPHEEIARLAYSYWEERLGEDGSPEEDWLRAERELRAQRVQVKTARTAAGSAGA